MPGTKPPDGGEVPGAAGLRLRRIFLDAGLPTPRLRDEIVAGGGVLVACPVVSAWSSVTRS